MALWRVDKIFSIEEEHKPLTSDDEYEFFAISP